MIFVGMLMMFGGILWGFADILRAYDLLDVFPWCPLCLVLAGVNVIIFTEIARLQP